MKLISINDFYQRATEIKMTHLARNQVPYFYTIEVNAIERCKHDVEYPGGNQRELARAKNLKKQQDGGKGKKKESGASKTQRMEKDAEIMRQKQLKKQAEKEKATSSGGGEKSAK